MRDKTIGKEVFLPTAAIKQLEFAWNGLGIDTGTSRDYQTAKIFYQKELRHARRVKDRSAMTWAMGNLGHSLIRLKNFKEARPYVLNTLKWGEAIHDDAAIGYANNLLGDIAYAQGQMEDANLFYLRGWEAFAKAGEKKGEAWSYANRGNASQEMGDFEAAIHMYEKSMALLEEMNDPNALAWNKNLMGSVNWAMGNYTPALKTYQEALELYRENKDVRGQAETLNLIGNLKLAMKEDEEAEELYRQASSFWSDEKRDPQGVAWYRYHMGEVYLFRKNLADAQEAFSKSLEIFDDLRDFPGRVATLTRLGETACLQEKYPQAQESLKRGVQLILKSLSNPLLADILMGMAQLLKGQGEDKKAISLLMAAFSHPACRQETKNRMVSLAMEWGTPFTPDEVDKGFGWAQGVDLEIIAKGWLRSLGKDSFLRVQKKAPLSRRIRKKLSKIKSKRKNKK